VHFSFGIITLLADFVDVESDEEVADKILTGGIVLVGLIAASFPVWPQDSHKQITDKANASRARLRIRFWATEYQHSR